MKTEHSLLILASTVLMACASPEQRAVGQMDTNTVKAEDTAGTDTVTNVNGRSGVIYETGIDSSIHTGAWSLAFSHPRTSLSTLATFSRPASTGFNKK